MEPAVFWPEPSGNAFAEGGALKTSYILLGVWTCDGGEVEPGGGPRGAGKLGSLVSPAILLYGLREDEAEDLM